MKISKIIIVFFVYTIYSCVGKKSHPNLPEKNIDFTSNYNNNSDSNHKYTDFPNEDSSSKYTLYYERFYEGGVRYGKIVENKEGKWLTGDAGFDENNNVYAKGKITKEEYFKKGLRDSVFKCFGKDGKVLYQTRFKMGTGLWKEFHNNDKIYFEAYTKNGYFNDTLKLNNDKGELFEKRFYKKDTLVYVINKYWSLRYRYKPNKENYLEVDSYDIDTINNLKQYKFRNTFKYKTRDEYNNDHFAKTKLQKM